MKNLSTPVLILILVTAMAVGPLITLWMLNTLFPLLAIPYTFKTWLAALLLNMLSASWGGRR
jgi:hypothetical protein